MPYIINKKCKIFYNHFNLQTQETPIFFIHGYANDWTTFTKQINYFKKQKKPIIYMDIRGHGKSNIPHTREQYTFKGIIQDINLILEKQKVQKITMIGHSMGGMIGLQYAIENPEKLNKLILIDTSYKFPTLIKIKNKEINLQDITRNTLFKKITKLILKLKISQKKHHFEKLKKLTQKSETLQHLMIKTATPLKTLICFLEEISQYNIKKELKKIQTKTLILQAKKDLIFKTEEGQTINQEISNSELIIYKGYHESTILEPELILKHIKQFIKK